MGLVHFCGMMIENLYGIIFPKHILLDKLYFISVMSVPLSWIICKDECLISYFIKKYENPQYILGSEPDNVKDIEELFYDKLSYSIFCHINHGLRLTSVILVNHRTTYVSYFLMIPTLSLYTMYVYHIFLGCRNNKDLFPYFRIILAFYLCFSIINIEV